MPAKEKKREQIRRTPKSFRSTIETDLALPLILDARNRELADAGIDDKVTTSDLFNEWVKNEWVRLREQDKIKQPVVDPYLTDDLGDNYRQRIPLRVGDEVVKGYQKTVPNLTIKDLEELHDSGHLKDPQQLASLGGATELHRYEDDRKNDIDCYKTPLGDFIKKWTSAKHYTWSHEGAVEFMHVSRDDVTDEDYEGAKSLGLTGVAGMYWRSMQARGGQRFWEHGPVLNMVAASETDGDGPQIRKDISIDAATDMEGLVSWLCDQLTGFIEDEAEVVKYCLGIGCDGHTLAETVAHFGDRQIDLDYVRNVVYGAIKRACMMRMQLALPDVFFKQRRFKGSSFFHIPNDEYTAMQLAEVFLPVFDPSSVEYQWIKRLIEEEAAAIVRGGKSVLVSREKGEDGSVHTVCTICPDVALRRYEDAQTVRGPLGLWELHAHRDPFDPEPTYVARQVETEHHEGLAMLTSYPELSDRSGTWVEYAIDHEGAPNACLLIAKDGELLDVAVLTEQIVEATRKSNLEFMQGVADLRKELDRSPSDLDIARHFEISTVEVRVRLEQINRSHQRMLSMMSRSRLKMEWMDGALSDSGQIVYEWKTPIIDILKKDVDNKEVTEQFHRLLMSTPLVKSVFTVDSLDLSNAKIEAAFRMPGDSQKVYARVHKDEGGPLGTLYEVGPLEETKFKELLERLEFSMQLRSVMEKGEPSQWVSGYTYEDPERGNLNADNPHVKALQGCVEDFQGARERGEPVRDWASGVTGDVVLLSSLPLKAVNREKLRQFCLDPETDVRAAVLAIMCWMGFSIRRAKQVWAMRNEWVHKMRSFKDPEEEYDPAEIYHFLAAIAKEPKDFPDYNGFYSCIAHFLDADAEAPIMNLRTSISVNLICKHDIVPDPVGLSDGYRLRFPYDVTQRYHSSVYKYFSKFINDLSKLIGQPADLLVDVLMDNSDESPWRAYLEEQEAPSYRVGI